MTDKPSGTAAVDFALDSEQQSLSSAVSAYRNRLRGGELGSLPALLAIAVLVLLFGAARPDTFIGVRNFAALLSQGASIVMISAAVSFVLLLGEIDLAAGFSAGVVAAVLATQLNDDRPLPLVILITLVVAILLGLFTGFLVAKVGIPSFVVTLPNFLSFQGIVLLITTEGGSVRIENETITAIDAGNMSIAFGWGLAVILVGAYAYAMIQRQRTSSGTVSMAVAVAHIAAIAIGAAVVVGMLSGNRAFPTARPIPGVPWVVPIVLIVLVGLTFALNRTAWGRHIFAVGGNAEAARRAGINVARIRMSAFVACAVVAGLGGYLIASRQGGANPQIGGGDTLLLAVGAAVIGGTSLFGGRGRLVNAVLGGAVLAIINNGLPLVGEASPFGLGEIDFSKSGIKFIVDGLVLLLAASVDALSRQKTGK